MTKLRTLMSATATLGTALLASELFDLWAYWLLKSEADVVSALCFVFMMTCGGLALRHR